MIQVQPTQLNSSTISVAEQRNHQTTKSNQNHFLETVGLDPRGFVNIFVLNRTKPFGSDLV